MSTTSHGRRGRTGTKTLAALASLAAALSMSGMPAAAAHAADAAGTAPVRVHSAQYDCDYYQVNTPPPFGDHRYAINNTCDQGLRHWVIVGTNIYFTGSITVYPASASDPYCDRYINNNRPTKLVPTVGGSCVNVDYDLMPAINKWGNYFG